MNIFKKMFNKNDLKLKPFDAQDVRIEWLEGNNLRVTFLTDSYMTIGDTITVIAPIVLNDITPGIVYDSGNEVNNASI